MLVLCWNPMVICIHIVKKVGVSNFYIVFIVVIYLKFKTLKVVYFFRHNQRSFFPLNDF